MLPRTARTVLAVALALGLAACTSGDSSAAPSRDASSPSSTSESTSASTSASGSLTSGSVTTSAGRTFDVVVPSGHGGEPAPLVVLLHGFQSTGDQIEEYVGLERVADARGMLYVHPDGSPGAGGQFWDAGPCCNFGGPPVDDAAYLAELIAQVGEQYAVDPDRVYVAGHSNGGFMAYRMACEHADLVAAVVSVSGAAAADPAACAPSQPVSVLHVHGDADQVIAYGGGSLLGPYPGAVQSVATWAGYDGCQAAPVPGPGPLDLDQQLPGAETSVSVHSGCPAGIGVELWTIAGGGHVPAFVDSFAEQVADWLLAHPRTG